MDLLLILSTLGVSASRFVSRNLRKTSKLYVFFEVISTGNIFGTLNYFCSLFSLLRSSGHHSIFLFYLGLIWLSWTTFSAFHLVHKHIKQKFKEKKIQDLCITNLLIFFFVFRIQVCIKWVNIQFIRENCLDILF